MNERRRNRPIEILQVEDSEVDAQLARVALDEMTTEIRLHHVVDGEQAMSFLRCEDEYEAAPRPDLILLDLSMPLKDGKEVLAEIRSDSDLRSLLVVVLTSSDNELDIRECYELNCNAYLTKPIDIRLLIDTFKAIELFFFRVAHLPTDS